LTEKRSHAVVLALSVEAMAIVMPGSWWYNPIASVASVLYLVSCYRLLSTPQSWGVRLSMAVSVFLVALMKPNVAGLLIVTTTLVLLTSRRHRWLVIAIDACGAALFFLLLAVNRIAPVVLLRSYLGVAGRGFTTRLFDALTVNEFLFVTLCLVLIAIPFVSQMAARQLLEGNRLHALCIAALLTGVYALLTNGDIRLVDTPLVMVAGALYVREPFVSFEAIGARRPWARYIGAVSIFLGTVAVGEAIIRHRVKGIGMNTFFEYATLPVPIKDGFFKHVTTGRRLPLVEQQVSEVLANVAKRANKPVSELTVYFGPRMQWAYASHRLQSPLGVPIWWHPGVSYSMADEACYIRRYRAAHFDVAIFLKNDATYLSAAALSAIQGSKERDETFSQLTVFTTREFPPSRAPRPSSCGIETELGRST
jgi:hypothetical protein